METDSLTERLDAALQHVAFTDVLGNRCNPSTLRELYETNRRYPIPRADAIWVREPELSALVTYLDPLLSDYKSPVSGLIGNGLYLLVGSLASPRLPSTADYARVLVLGAARLGTSPVVDLITSWLGGQRIRVSSCVLLKGVVTEQKLEIMDGMCLETLSNNGNDFPRSLRISRSDIDHEQFAKRAMLRVEYETIAPLYQPEDERGHMMSRPPSRTPVNSQLAHTTIGGLCRAMSLETNGFVDWFIQWDDYGDAEAFFLNPGFSSARKETNSPSMKVISETQARRCIDIDTLLRASPFLDLSIARWRRSKRSTATDEQLVELRIALESAFLGDDRGAVGEKRHRLAARGAWFLGKTFEEREHCFRTLRDAYDHASSVIHAGTPSTKNKDRLRKAIVDAQDLCRNAILQMAVAGGMPNWTDVILARDRHG